MINCCKDCTDRKFNCHSSCQKYLKAKTKNQLILSKQNKEKDKKAFINDVCKKSFNIFYDSKKKNTNRYILK